MSDGTLLAAEAVRQVPFWEDGTATLLQALGGGSASVTWMVGYRGDRYVLRVDTPLAATLGLKRAAETAVIESAAAAGLAAEVVFASPERGIVVTRFVEGRTWSRDDLNVPRQLHRLARLLRKVHSLTPAVRELDLGAAADTYARQLDTPQATRWAEQAKALLAPIGPRPKVLCHNDPVARNVVDGERLWLIDWEYGALGDPLFDLAVVVRHHDLDRRLSAVFLAAYADGLPLPGSDLVAYYRIYDRLLALWLSVVSLHDPLTTAQQRHLKTVSRRIGTDAA